jgi:hypothetical protein
MRVFRILHKLIRRGHINPATSMSILSSEPGNALTALDFLVYLSIHYFCPTERSAVILPSSIHRVYDVTMMSLKALSILKKATSLLSWRESLMELLSSFMGASTIDWKAGGKREKFLAAYCILGGGGLASVHHGCLFFNLKGSSDTLNRIDHFYPNSNEILYYITNDISSQRVSHVYSSSLPHSRLCKREIIPTDDSFHERRKRENPANAAKENVKSLGDIHSLRHSSMGKSLHDSICEYDAFQLFVYSVLDCVQTFLTPLGSDEIDKLSSSNGDSKPFKKLFFFF